jgi:hypothetical protein
MVWLNRSLGEEGDYFLVQMISTCLPSCRGGGGGVGTLWLQIQNNEAKFLDEMQTKVLRVFLLVIHNHSHLHSFALGLLCLACNLLQFLQFSYSTLHKEKGGPPVRKPYPLLCSLINSYINPKSAWALSRLCRETSTNLYVHEFCFCDASLVSL